MRIICILLLLGTLCTYGDSIPCVADFDGDGISDPTVFSTDTGVWIIRCSSLNWSNYFIAGVPGDVGLVGDFDNDGRADPTSYVNATRRWSVKLSSRNYATVTFVIGLVITKE